MRGQLLPFQLVYGSLNQECHLCFLLHFVSLIFSSFSSPSPQSFLPSSLLIHLSSIINAIKSSLFINNWTLNGVSPVSVCGVVLRGVPFPCAHVRWKRKRQSIPPPCAIVLPFFLHPFFLFSLEHHLHLLVSSLYPFIWLIHTSCSFIKVFLPLFQKWLTQSEHLSLKMCIFLILYKYRWEASSFSQLWNLCLNLFVCHCMYITYI